MKTGLLSPLAVSRQTNPGRFGDGGGLYLQVKPSGAKSWLFRYQRDGKPLMMGLGAYPAVPLAEARKKAEALRNLRASKIDPRDARTAERDRRRDELAQARPFEDCAKEYIAANKTGWKNRKHAQQWPNTLESYVYPLIGTEPVGSLGRDAILKVMRQQVPAEVASDGRVIHPAGEFWTARPDTAQRVRGRIELVLDWAKVHGYRKGENPAAWRGNLQFAWPNRGKGRKRRHHPALPYAQIPDFMRELRKQDGVAALALEFCILNAPRTMEVLKSRLQEIDRAGALWTIPDERMKAGEEHRVPLTDAALAVLEKADKLRTEGDLVFPGRKRGKPLSSMAMLMLARRMGYTDARGQTITVHGFRSTFRDWVADCTSFPREVAEMALAHAIEDDVEAAYRRGDLMEKRRALMNAWADYCAGKSNVVPIVAAAA